jgi:hypothetical protein
LLGWLQRDFCCWGASVILAAQERGVIFVARALSVIFVAEALSVLLVAGLASA